MRTICFLFLMIVAGCTCDEKQLVELTEFEKTIIATRNAQTLNFTNATNEIIVAESSDVRALTRDVGLDENCGNFLAEYRFYTLNLQNMLLRIDLSKSRDAKVGFTIEIFESRFSPHCGGGVDSLEPFLTDYQFEEFSYEDVFVFEFCGLTMVSDQLTNIKTIIFIRNKGIDLITYEDGSYLKLVE